MCEKIDSMDEKEDKAKELVVELIGLISKSEEKVFFHEFMEKNWGTIDVKYVYKPDDKIVEVIIEKTRKGKMNPPIKVTPLSISEFLESKGYYLAKNDEGTFDVCKKE